MGERIKTIIKTRNNTSGFKDEFTLVLVRVVLRLIGETVILRDLADKLFGVVEISIDTARLPRCIFNVPTVVYRLLVKLGTYPDVTSHFTSIRSSNLAHFIAVVTVSIEDKLTVADVVLVTLIEGFDGFQTEVFPYLCGASYLLYGYVFSLGLFLDRLQFGDTFLLVASNVEKKVVDTFAACIA